MSFAEWFNNVVDKIPAELIIPGSLGALIVLLIILFAINNRALKQINGAQSATSHQKADSLIKRNEISSKMGASPAATSFKPVRRSKRKQVPASRSAQATAKKRA
ncbi:MAG: hypothetical protein WBN97_11685 [Parvibaculum sp.]